MTDPTDPTDPRDRLTPVDPTARPPAPAAAMTPAEREAQRRSFVYGNTKLAHADVTRDMVDDAADAERTAPETPTARIRMRVTTLERQLAPLPEVARFEPPTRLDVFERRIARIERGQLLNTIAIVIIAAGSAVAALIRLHVLRW
jgi:hypothetical protein